MSSSDSLAMIRAISMRAPVIKVLAYGIPDLAEHIFACAEVGASGYLLKDATIDELEASLGPLLNDDFAYPPSIVAHIVKRLASLSRPPSISDALSLSPRQIEIAGCLTEGLSNKEIARQLNIDVQTVKNHVHNILTKLHLTRRGEAAHVFETIEPLGRTRSGRVP
jgi:DNA-binding NarL/FixJ family response regulator